MTRASLTVAGGAHPCGDGVRVRGSGWRLETSSGGFYVQCGIDGAFACSYRSVVVMGGENVGDYT